MKSASGQETKASQRQNMPTKTDKGQIRLRENYLRFCVKNIYFACHYMSFCKLVKITLQCYQHFTILIKKIL